MITDRIDQRHFHETNPDIPFSLPGRFLSFLPSRRIFRPFQNTENPGQFAVQVGFNTCDITQFENLISDDFEFYHDRSGITSSKAAFIVSMRDGLCKMDYKARRELVENSLEVFPLENNGVLYGAIQTGNHRFYALEKDKPEYLSSVARFTHVWLLEDGLWKLSRGLSYDHIGSN